MDEQTLQDIFAELFSALEPLEAQSAALLQLVKSKGIANDEDLAPFLEQAGNASNVRWRAMRVRTAALISAAMKPEQAPENGETNEANAESAVQATEKNNQKKEAQAKPETRKAPSRRDEDAPQAKVEGKSHNEEKKTASSLAENESKPAA